MKILVYANIDANIDEELAINMSGRSLLDRASSIAQRHFKQWIEQHLGETSTESPISFASVDDRHEVLYRPQLIGHELEYAAGCLNVRIHDAYSYEDDFEDSFQGTYIEDDMKDPDPISGNDLKAFIHVDYNPYTYCLYTNNIDASQLRPALAYIIPFSFASGNSSHGEYFKEVADKPIPLVNQTFTWESSNNRYCMMYTVHDANFTQYGASSASVRDFLESVRFQNRTYTLQFPVVTVREGPPELTTTVFRDTSIVNRNVAGARSVSQGTLMDVSTGQVAIPYQEYTGPDFNNPYAYWAEYLLHFGVISEIPINISSMRFDVRSYVNNQSSNYGLEVKCMFYVDSTEATRLGWINNGSPVNPDSVTQVHFNALFVYLTKQIERYLSTFRNLTTKEACAANNVGTGYELFFITEYNNGTPPTQAFYKPSNYVTERADIDKKIAKVNLNVKSTSTYHALVGRYFDEDNVFVPRCDVNGSECNLDISLENDVLYCLIYGDNSYGSAHGNMTFSVHKQNTAIQVYRGNAVLETVNGSVYKLIPQAVTDLNIDVYSST